jgi:hypothetical protein
VRQAIRENDGLAVLCIADAFGLRDDESDRYVRSLVGCELILEGIRSIKGIAKFLASIGK